MDFIKIMNTIPLSNDFNLAFSKHFTANFLPVDLFFIEYT